MDHSEQFIEVLRNPEEISLKEYTWKKMRSSVQSMVLDYSGDPELSKRHNIIEEWPSFIDQIQTFKGLYELNLRHCKLQEHHLNSLLNDILLYESNNLVKLNIEHNGITASVLKPIMKKLFVYNYKLYELKVHENNPKDCVEFTMLNELWVSEFNKRNTAIAKCLRNLDPALVINVNHELPRLCPTMMKKLIDKMPHLTHITFVGWLPPTNKTLLQKKKKKFKTVCETDVLKYKHVENMFENLSRIKEFRALFMTRRDIEVVRTSLRKKKTTVKSCYTSNWLHEISHFRDIKKLELNDCSIGEISPESIAKLNSLENLSIKNDLIIIIPSEIGSLMNLTVLHLNGNDIEDVSDDLSTLNNLRELHLHDNQIKKIPTKLALWFPVLKDLKILNQKWRLSCPVLDLKIEGMRIRELESIENKEIIGFLEFYHHLKNNPYSEYILLKNTTDKKKALPQK